MQWVGIRLTIFNMNLVVDATQEAAAAGTLDPNSLKPNFVQRLFVPPNSKRARYQGELQRFNESGLAQEAEQYGVSPAQVGSGRVNLAEIRTNVDSAKELKGLKSQARGLRDGRYDGHAAWRCPEFDPRSENKQSN